MKLETQKDLRALARLCHSEGIKSITIGDTKIEFGDKPEAKTKVKALVEPVEEQTQEYTDEDILNWSVTQVG